jgi:very-short-patch-repair endonuclease
MVASHLSPAQLALLEARARHMRFHLTPSEAFLWSLIRGKRLGVQFRRQVVVGRFIVDFAAPAARLVVEVDGGYHARRVGPDARRDAALRALGWRVVRVDAGTVMAQPGEALRCVVEALGG